MIIVVFEVRVRDFPITVEKMLREIAACDPKEASVFIIQILELRIFDGADDLILDYLIHSILRCDGAGVGLSGLRWRSTAPWGILPGWAGWLTLWLRGWCIESVLLLFQ